MKRKHRLASSRDIRRVYAVRRPRPGSLLTMHAVPNELGVPRFAFSVSTRVGGAVLRNRLRRRLRAAAMAAGLGGWPMDVVVVARPAAATASYAELAAELQALFELAGYGPAA